MVSFRICMGGALVAGTLFLSGCHSSQKTGAQPLKPSSSPPVTLASPTPVEGVSHAFVPYADKPPLGTPVETH
ncbi:MAG: hypothetical protein ACYDBP_06920 [Leptospirales bacterium]